MSATPEARPTASDAVKFCAQRLNLICYCLHFASAACANAQKEKDVFGKLGELLEALKMVENKVAIVERYAILSRRAHATDGVLAVLLTSLSRRCSLN